MVEKLRRDRVGLGLIGLGPGWEDPYRETLIRLQKRLTIRLVYDSVEAKAKSVASEFDADVAGSLRQILTRPALQGLLVLDLGWIGAGALSLIARSGKPVYLGRPALRHAAGLMSIAESSRPNVRLKTKTLKADDLLMPEFGFRFTPASCRLRELIATKLGAVKGIRIECNLKAEVSEIAYLVDWCSDLVGQHPSLRVNHFGKMYVPSSIDLEFPSVTKGATPRMASLVQSNDPNGSVRVTVECESGKATLRDRAHIAWKTSTDFVSESLADERSEIDILIDQFCRRVVGGLNPVGRLSDYERALEIVEMFQRS